jgi:hypothetical protein
MATKPQGESQYGDISSAPGRRCKLEDFDTSVGSKATVLGANPTVNAAKAAIATAVIADRAVTSTSIGLASRVEA